MALRGQIKAGHILLAVVLFVACFGMAAAYRLNDDLLPWQSPPAAPPFEDVAPAYIAYWQAGDYAGMYNLLTDDARTAWSYEEFAAFHDNTYKRMQVNSMSLQYHTTQLVDQSLTQATADYTFDATLTGIGSVQFPNLTMPLVYNDLLACWQVDFAPDMLLPNLQRDEVVRVVELLPTRGEIFSADGVLLARNTYAHTVYVTIGSIGSQPEERQAFCATAAQLLQTTAESIEDAITSTAAQRDGYAILRAYPANTIPQDVREGLLALPGVGIDTRVYTPVREYPEGSLLSHTIGYMGAISEDKLAEYLALGYNPDEKVGLAGVELAYESTLYGKKGWRLQRMDAENNVQQTYVDIPAQAGQDVWLTINSKVQSFTEDLLAQRLEEEQRGVIIVMNPKTGRVETMASYPTYDHNIFSWPITSARWEELINDPEKPLYDRATMGLYPPGSSFKPFTSAMALELGLVTTDTVFNQPVVNNKWTPQGYNWVYPAITRHLDVPDPVNMRNAIVHSDNIYFAWLALKIGGDEFISRTQKLGFGQPFDSDIPVALSKITNQGPITNLRLLADSGYGQGELLVSPLQMAATFSAFANNGDIPKPMVVDHTGWGDGTGLNYTISDSYTPTTLYEDIITSASINAIQPLMHDVCVYGTGSSVGLLNLSGKTGTAELDSVNGRVIAWFIGYIDDGSKDRLVLVMLEVPTGQGGGRYQLARDVLEKAKEVLDAPA